MIDAGVLKMNLYAPYSAPRVLTQSAKHSPLDKEVSDNFIERLARLDIDNVLARQCRVLPILHFSGNLLKIGWRTYRIIFTGDA